MQANLPSGIEEDKEGAYKTSLDLQEILRAVGLALRSHHTLDP